MGQDVKNSSRVCPLPPSPLKNLNRLMIPRPIYIAASLAFILATTGLFYYLMLPTSLPPQPPPFELPSHIPTTPHGAIMIDGDANFSDTASLEGWLGDGSPENPFIIDGLGIDLGGNNASCISIYNTRVSFTIGNCNLTSARETQYGPIWGAGIYIENVTNGELSNNICHGNDRGIVLIDSNFNTVVNNTCFSNDDLGIRLWSSNYNTVANNTCYSNSEYGINLFNSHQNMVIHNTCTISFTAGIIVDRSNHNIVFNNTCYSNTIFGIFLWYSNSNTMANNTCITNKIGIYLYESPQNSLVHNTFFNNKELDILEEFDSTLLLFIGFTGFIVITLLGGVIVGNRLSKVE